MFRKVALIVLLIALNASPVFSQDRMRVSIFLNPYKWILGLCNVGFELQYNSNCSVCVFAEYAGVRTAYLNKIRHPDLVATVGLRYYPAQGDPDAAGSYAGISSSYFFRKPGEGRKETMDVSFGVEAGYKLSIDDSFYFVPRGLLNYTIRGNRLLPGVEVLGGMLL